MALLVGPIGIADESIELEIVISYFEANVWWHLLSKSGNDYDFRWACMYMYRRTQLIGLPLARVHRVTTIKNIFNFRLSHGCIHPWS